MSHYKERMFPKKGPSLRPKYFNGDIKSTVPLTFQQNKRRLTAQEQKEFAKLTPKQKKAIVTALFITSMGIGLAADSNIALASAPVEIDQNNCGIDWFDPSQTCMCDYTEGSPPMTVRKPGNGCGGQQTQNTLPSPESEQNKTGLTREIPGSTDAFWVSVVFILAGVGGLYIANRLNNDMPN